MPECERAEVLDVLFEYVQQRDDINGLAKLTCFFAVRARTCVVSVPHTLHVCQRAQCCNHAFCVKGLPEGPSL